MSYFPNVPHNLAIFTNTSLPSRSGTYRKGRGVCAELHVVLVTVGRGAAFAGFQEPKESWREGRRGLREVREVKSWSEGVFEKRVTRFGRSRLLVSKVKCQIWSHCS